MIKRRRRAPATPPEMPKGASDGAKGMELGEHIGRELRAMFAHVAAEPVPEKFRQLLDELERKSNKR